MPFDGVSTAAATQMILVLVVVSVIPLACNLLGRWVWDDWLDQRLGRGSTKDEYPSRHW